MWVYLFFFENLPYPSLLCSRLPRCHAMLPGRVLSGGGDRCVTSQKMAAKETTQACQQMRHTSNSPFQGSYLTLVFNNLGSQQESESLTKARDGERRGVSCVHLLDFSVAKV